MSFRVAAILAAFTLSACATHIQPQDQTIVPSRVPFSKYANVVVLPLAVGHSDQDAGDRRAIEKVDSEFSTCIRGALPMAIFITPSDSYPASTLIIAPSIDDMTKKTVGERIVLGPITGSSALLLHVTYTDAADHSALASPVFYAKANAWGGAFTFGSTDNLIMSRAAHLACQYTSNNR